MTLLNWKSLSQPKFSEDVDEAEEPLVVAAEEPLVVAAEEPLVVAGEEPLVVAAEEEPSAEVPGVEVALAVEGFWVVVGGELSLDKGYPHWEEVSK